MPQRRVNESQHEVLEWARCAEGRLQKLEEDSRLVQEDENAREHTQKRGIVRVFVCLGSRGGGGLLVLVPVHFVSSPLTLDMSQLEQLRKHTTVVADSGDFHSYSALKGSIQDGTTNPSVRDNNNAGGVDTRPPFFWP